MAPVSPRPSTTEFPHEALVHPLKKTLESSRFRSPDAAGSCGSEVAGHWKLRAIQSSTALVERRDRSAHSSTSAGFPHEPPLRTPQATPRRARSQSRGALRLAEASL